jgi:hypothetical protein
VRFDKKKRAKIRKFCGASLALVAENSLTDMSPEHVTTARTMNTTMKRIGSRKWYHRNNNPAMELLKSTSRRNDNEAEEVVSPAHYSRGNRSRRGAGFYTWQKLPPKNIHFASGNGRIDGTDIDIAAKLAAGIPDKNST